jgi:hypothetical protein
MSTFRLGALYPAGTCSDVVTSILVSFLQALVPPPALSNAQQLDVLEQLLWQGGSKASTGRWAGVRQWLLKAVLGLVELQLDDVRCQYVVPSQLGPDAAQQQDAGQRDGVAISIRSLVLTPGVVVASGAAAGTTSSSSTAARARAAESTEGPTVGERS